MQRGWRKWVLLHRLNALIKIKNWWKQIEFPEFYIEGTVYWNLRKIIDNEVNRWRFEEQWINFEISDDGRAYGQVFFSKTDRYNSVSIIPRWFGFEIPIKYFDDVIDSDPYELIHKHSYISTGYDNKIELWTYSDIAELNKITGLQNVNELNFVRVTWDSVVEAKRRVAILALISYNVRNGTFIRGYSK